MSILSLLKLVFKRRRNVGLVSADIEKLGNLIPLSKTEL